MLHMLLRQLRHILRPILPEQRQRFRHDVCLPLIDIQRRKPLLCSTLVEGALRDVTVLDLVRTREILAVPPVDRFQFFEGRFRRTEDAGN